MKTASSWRPPGKDCGLCGEHNCGDFLNRVDEGQKTYANCPFYEKEGRKTPGSTREANYTGKDVLGNAYDFILTPLPGEISARKIVLPFRGDMVEKMAIKKGDYVLGRPMGAGCPIPHVLQVLEADVVTGLLYTWVVGPKVSREQKVKDVHAYHMIGFEGIAAGLAKELILGTRVTFLPGLCMMNLNHTGLLNMALEKNTGFHVRVEDIRILA